MSFAVKASLYCHDKAVFATFKRLLVIVIKPSLFKRVADIVVLLAYVFCAICYRSNPCPTASKRRHLTMLVDRTVIVLVSHTTNGGGTHKNATQNTPFPTIQS